MDSSSGIITEETAAAGEYFSDFTPIPCKGFNTLCKAKRYGRWWVLKGLKPQNIMVTHNGGNIKLIHSPDLFLSSYP